MLARWPLLSSPNGLRACLLLSATRQAQLLRYFPFKYKGLPPPILSILWLGFVSDFMQDLPKDFRSQQYRYHQPRSQRDDHDRSKHDCQGDQRCPISPGGLLAVQDRFYGPAVHSQVDPSYDCDDGNGFPR